jgi:hypothetical protein
MPRLGGLGAHPTVVLVLLRVAVERAGSRHRPKAAMMMQFEKMPCYREESAAKR